MTRIGIRTKIVIMVAVALLLALGVSAFLIRGLVYQNIVSQKMTTVDILTASLVHDIKYNFQTDGQEGVHEIIGKYATYYQIIKDIDFFNPELISMGSFHPEHEGRKTGDPDVAAAVSFAKPALKLIPSEGNDLAIRSVAPILQGSRIVGAVKIEVSIRDIQATLSAIDRRIGAILLGTVLAASLVLFILLRSTILLRLNRLMEGTYRIARGNYDVRLADNRKDEIGELGRAFDRMTSDLKKSRREIEEYQKHLEARIQDATAELQKAYDDLKNVQSQVVLNEKMASLGVLIAGIAHEINTPIGAIHNVARNLETKVESLPELLKEFQAEPKVSAERFFACLEEFLQRGSTGYSSPSYKEVRNLETFLQKQGVSSWRETAETLGRLHVTEPEIVQKHLDCLRSPSLLSLVEAIVSIAQAARISKSSSTKIQEIIQALKYYAYTDKDRVERVQINESIQTSLVLLRSRLKHAVRVETNLAPDLPPVPCTSEIHQVWTNLLNNACDAIGEMGDDYSGKISISTKLTGDHVRVEVTDNGIGIPEDKKNKIFDPFFTTKDIGKGTGMGLSVAYGIVQAHGGALDVEVLELLELAHRELHLVVGQTGPGAHVPPLKEHVAGVDATRLGDLARLCFDGGQQIASRLA